MMDQDQEPFSRPLRRSDYTKKKKMDRILTYLIIIVSVLIVVNFISLLTKDTERPSEIVKEDSNKDGEINSDVNENSNVEKNEAESKSNEQDSTTDDGQLDSEDGQIIVRPSDDPIVSEVIENPKWDVTPTGQTGEHISAYDAGNIDYQEKLLTLRNAVKFDENNIIYWSVKHNGSTSQSVGVVSNYDQSEMYRIYIEWVDGKGWKPVRVERLLQLEGAY